MKINSNGKVVWSFTKFSQLILNISFKFEYLLWNPENREHQKQGYGMVSRKRWVRKFFLNLKISEAFMIGLKILFLGDFASWSLRFFLSRSWMLIPGSHSLTKSWVNHSILLEAFLEWKLYHWNHTIGLIQKYHDNTLWVHSFPMTWIRISDSRSLGSRYIRSTNASFSRLDWWVPLMCYVLRDQITDPDPDHSCQCINDNY